MVDLKKNLKSFKYAFKGLYLFFRNENNAKFHLLASLLVIFLGFFFNINRYEWLWILLAISLVWIAEALNKAIEKLTDLISPDYNLKAGEIKDLSAGGVLITAFLSIIIAIIIFKDYFILFIFM